MQIETDVEFPCIDSVASRLQALLKYLVFESTARKSRLAATVLVDGKPQPRRFHRSLGLGPLHPTKRGSRDSKELIAQYLLLLDGSTYDRLWDFMHQKLAVTIFIKEADYLSGKEIISSIESLIEQFLPSVKTTFGGDYMLSYHWVDLIKTDQIKSFLVSLLLIFLVSSGLFCSFKKGFVVTSPIVMAILMNYGILGFCTIPISVSVSMFSAIILGIGIDYAIHFQNKFDVLINDMGEEEAILGVFTTAGKAIFWNILVVVAGFLTLIFSQTPPNQKLGLICALGVTASFISSISVLPVFLLNKKPK